MHDSLLTLAAPAAGLQLLVVTATRLARDARERHQLSEGSAAVLAQALAGTLLLVASEPGDPESARVDVQLECRGPLRGLLVDADGNGSIRGMVRVSDLDRAGKRGGEPQAEAPAGPTRFDARALLEGGLGDEVGMLSILRRQPGGTETELHRALVPFAGADLAAGLTAFLQSDRPGAGHMVAEVLFRGAEPLATVAGALLGPLDEANEDQAEAAAKIAKELRAGGLTRLLQADGAGNAHALAQRISEVHGLGPLQLKSEQRPRFSCRCSRERLVRALQTLPAPELVDMAETDGGAEATCDFCAECYVVTKDELLALAGAGERV